MAHPALCGVYKGAPLFCGRCLPGVELRDEQGRSRWSGVRAGQGEGGQVPPDRAPALGQRDPVLGLAE